MAKVKAEPYAYQVWLRYGSSRPQCISSGASRQSVSESYLYHCELLDCDTVLVTNDANGDDRDEGPLRAIVSRSEGSTLTLEECREVLP